jgi:transcriptional regulator with XRE-family HTH domain
MRIRHKLVANGAAIRTIRQLKGWSLREFAGRCRISESHLGNVENDRRDLSPASLLRVAAALQVPISAITTSGELKQQALAA